MSTTNISLEEKYKLVAHTIRAYPLQLKQAWEEINTLFIPEDYKNVSNVVVSGMGGSALGARIIDSYIVDKIRLPIEIYTEYHLPNYVNKNTLVISYSYSGNTEETINATYEALQRNAKIFCVTTGGKLSEIAEKENIPAYVFNPINNPSKEPRMSLGYSIGTYFSLFHKLGFISLDRDDIDTAINSMYEFLTEFHENIDTDKNLAYKLASSLKNYIPVIITSEHLYGISHAIKNQINENSKTFSILFDIPELNHHLLEGLRNPDKIKKDFKFLFFNSSKYSEKIQKRYKITAEVVEKNGFEYLIYNPRSDTKLKELFEIFILGSFISYYLAKFYQVDPLKIPWVDYFKERLSK
ncbi:MAG: Bifunctional phosphoglucose/phosphomannose isomerase [Candidatus Woesebacteria bacterium GW2011_GWB1_39_12]|uniref:Bifunctional phosphoglucose/phosphomannose isomerase n=2 Tax=Candidatus Woeseibacteriota TaxID=1752722 RepID=A0A0G0MB12_9BACT|nr:MAG: Bifunctional phosphoglucose/phosphomannose isomerase [Candidatus Woesebacteria bacterium GW2011_GWA1_39_12]KKR00514.1 MAG: Bifunctional phosphoglucose/phosphomannose isomerase [Candidatus Woesebacteria bacterium GW2011_GWB1_39_12]